MSDIESQLDPNSTAVSQNADAMCAVVEELRAIEHRVIETTWGKEECYHKQGLMPPIERLAHLLDAGAQFFNLIDYLQEGDNDGSRAGGNTLSAMDIQMEPSVLLSS